MSVVGTSGGMRWALVGGLAVAASLGMAAAQFSVRLIRPPMGSSSSWIAPRMPDEQPYVAREMQERQLKRLREEHQKEVFSDTDRLVQLATALKAEVDKGDKAATSGRAQRRG